MGNGRGCYVWRFFCYFKLFSFIFVVVGCGKVVSKVDTDYRNAFGVAGLHNYQTWAKDWDSQTYIVGTTAGAAEDSHDFVNRILATLLHDTGFFTQGLNPTRALWAPQLKNALHIEKLGANRGDNLNKKSDLSISFVTFSNKNTLWHKALGIAETNPRALLETQWHALEAQSQVLWVEPDLASHVTAQPAEFSSTTMKEFVSGMKLDAAYDYWSQRNITPRFVNVAVMDTGVDYAHPELKNQMLVNPGENPQNETFPAADGVDNDGNGYIDDIYGIDATVPPGTVDSFSPGAADVGGPGVACPSEMGRGEGESCGHGTHVAGIIAAEQSNPYQNEGGFSVAGVCPACKILSLRVSCRKVIGSSSSECRPPIKSDGTNIVNAGIFDSSQLRAMDYVLNYTRPQDRSQLQVNILNASIGKYTRSRAMAYKVRELTNAGVIIVAAAGNEGTDSFSYPAAFSSVLSVCATDNLGVKPSFSNFGSWVDVCAPGVDIYSTVPGPDGIEPKSGTSMASPVVAGLAGLILSLYPTMTPEQITGLIKRSANFQRLYGQESNRIFENKYADGTVFYQLGSGVVDANAAVQQQTQSDAGDTAGNLNSRVKDGCVVSAVAPGQQQLSTPFSHKKQLGILAVKSIEVTEISHLNFLTQCAAVLLSFPFLLLYLGMLPRARRREASRLKRGSRLPRP